jgi:hypothetical protein
MSMEPLSMTDPDDLALVIFTGETDITWLKVFKSGFRHCFACVHTAGQWILYDPLAHVTTLSLYSDIDSVDLEFWFRQHGCSVIRTTLKPARLKKSPPGFFTCVEAVKRVLGIQTLFVQTPWQLYRHLSKRA